MLTNPFVTFTINLRMVRVIAVIDVELQARNWEKRELIMKTFIQSFKSGKLPTGKFELKRTHMKGFRLKINEIEDLDNLLNNRENQMKIEDDFNLPFNMHSQTEFASIFFIDWPLDLLSVLPRDLK